MNSKKAYAKVLADSQFGKTRIVTLEIDLWRAILPEFNTHRMISRNFQSTRAVPTANLIRQVRENPYIPVKFARNQQGMVAGETLVDQEHNLALSRWLIAAQSAADNAQNMVDVGVHKEISGRLIEPFMWTRGVVTATMDGWVSFLNLRLHPDAQPEIQALAKEIQNAIESSNPQLLKEGELHVPYVTKKYENGNVHYYSTEGELLTEQEAIKISASCCAQVSYRRLDDSLEKALKVYDMLNLPVNGVYPDEPPHYSPSEHIAIAHKTKKKLSGNFHSKDFIQYRKLLEKGLEGEYVKQSV